MNELSGKQLNGGDILGITYSYIFHGKTPVWIKVEPLKPSLLSYLIKPFDKVNKTLLESQATNLRWKNELVFRVKTRNQFVKRIFISEYLWF